MGGRKFWRQDKRPGAIETLGDKVGKYFTNLLIGTSPLSTGTFKTGAGTLSLKISRSSKESIGSKKGSTERSPVQKFFVLTLLSTIAGSEAPSFIITRLAVDDFY